MCRVHYHRTHCHNKSSSLCILSQNGKGHILSIYYKAKINYRQRYKNIKQFLLIYISIHPSTNMYLSIYLFYLSVYLFKFSSFMYFFHSYSRSIQPCSHRLQKRNYSLMNSQPHIHRIWHRLVRRYNFCNLYNQSKENRNKIFKENIKEVKDVSQKLSIMWV